MINTFVNPVVSPDAQLGVSLFDETDPLRLWQDDSVSDVEIVIRAVYRQVLGNAHVMESERLTVSESRLKQGDITVREFVRQVAQSDLYRTRFFETCSRSRSIELNFKHLLGRAPESHEEIAEHGRWLDQGGFEAEIDTYIDSDEYQVAFGDNTVPYYRGYKTQTGKKIVGFTHLFQLLRGSASSDQDLTHQNRSRLNASLMANRPSAIPPVKGAPFKDRALDRNWMPPIPSQVSTADTTWQTQSYQAYQPSQGTAPAEQALRQSIQEQAQVIDRLQQQLAALRPIAAIGASYLKSDWQPSAVSGTEEKATSLQRQADAQVAQIAALQDQIADHRRYAAIGEARLNKWRSRTFNG